MIVVSTARDGEKSHLVEAAARRGSYSPTREKPSLLPKALAQSKKERKEQKQRVKELRQKRRAIEAQNREMKLKSVKSQQAQLMLITPASRQHAPLQGHQTNKTHKAGKVKTDLQQISTI